MFDNSFRFRGSHAMKARYLTDWFGSNDEPKKKIFETYFEAYLCGALIGFKYNLREEPDDNNDEDLAEIRESVFANNKDKCILAYRSIILNSWKDRDDEWRIDNTFRSDANEKAVETNMDLFNSYVLGGISWLYEKFRGKTKLEDVINIMSELVNDA